ncbi:hypothetical protein AVEN_159979-1 [Araneus ventricosus]|uniref:Uncharacterized protein n=1 Tax=Araneus ventricosus TaxID=182803 RepID=A0A4Y2RDV3_ARAVE|nr:hypothetical protein AVEN_159979-1 [Araneus ventricosus]
MVHLQFLPFLMYTFVTLHHVHPYSLSRYDVYKENYCNDQNSNSKDLGQISSFEPPVQTKQNFGICSVKHDNFEIEIWDKFVLISYQVTDGEQLGLYEFFKLKLLPRRPKVSPMKTKDWVLHMTSVSTETTSEPKTPVSRESESAVKMERERRRSPVVSPSGLLTPPAFKVASPPESGFPRPRALSVIRCSQIAEVSPSIIHVSVLLFFMQ